MTNSFHLKLIPNFTYRKEGLSIPLRNKDFYLFNLLHKKNIKNKECVKVSKNENTNNRIKKAKKLIILKELNTNNIFQNINKNYKNQDETRKNFDINFKYFFLKAKKKVYRYNSCHFVAGDKTNKLENSHNIKNPLIITSFSKNNLSVKEKNKNRKNKLNKLKRSFTYKCLNENKIQKLDEDYFISNSISKNYQKRKIKIKKSEGTQINLNYVNYNNFNSHKITTTISRNKYCSPKSIIFQRDLKNS